MQDAGEPMATGTIVGKFAGPDGEEIAAVVVLPTAVWNALTDGLIERHDIDHWRDLNEAEWLAQRIAVFLDMKEVGWRYQARGSARNGGDLFGDIPF